MCSLIDKLLMVCGPTPIFDYSVIGLGIAVVVLFLLRPRY
jgi:hypothetical protein